MEEDSEGGARAKEYSGAGVSAFHSWRGRVSGQARELWASSTQLRASAGGAGGRYPKHARLGGGSSAEKAIAHARSKTRRHTPAPPGPSAENKNVPRTGIHPKTNSPFEERRSIKFRKNASGFRGANRYAKRNRGLVFRKRF